MVDSAIVCDFLHLFHRESADTCIIVSDDDDYIPPLLTAQTWAADAILLRRSASNVSRVTDADCSKNIAFWSDR